MNPLMVFAYCYLLRLSVHTCVPPLQSFQICPEMRSMFIPVWPLGQHVNAHPVGRIWVMMYSMLVRNTCATYAAKTLKTRALL